MVQVWSKMERGARRVGGILVVSLGMLAAVACGQQAAAPTATPTEAQAPALLPTPITQPTTQVSPIADTGPTPAPTIVGERPVSGGTWTTTGDWTVVDPWHLLATSDGAPIFYNGLIQQKYPYAPSKGIEYEPYLATEYSQSEDGSKWRFKLRQGVTFHDGEVFNADDVVATIQRGLDQKYLARAQQVAMRKTFVGVKKIDDYTVELDTGQTDAIAFAYFTSPWMMMVPGHLIRGEDPTSTDVKKRWRILGPTTSSIPNGTGTLAVGTGPWKMVKWTPQVELLGERNPNYFKFDQYGNRLPYMEKYSLLSVPDATRRLAYFVAGQTESTRGLGTGMTDKQARSICQQTRDPDCYTESLIHAFGAIYLNPTSTTQFTDPKVVQAARYSQDIDRILRETYGGALSQGYMWVDRNQFPDSALSVKEQHEALPWSNPARRDEFVQKGKDLMAEAGYSNGFDMPYPMYSGTTASASGFCTGIYLDEISRHVDHFYRAGIRGALECRQGVLGGDELKANRWSMHFTATPMPFLHPGQGIDTWALLSSGALGGAPWRWEGQQALDDQFRAAIKTVDTAKRNQLYKDIERYLANPSLTTVPHGHSYIYYAAHGCVRNYRPGGIWFSHNYSIESTWLQPDSKCRQ